MGVVKTVMLVLLVSVRSLRSVMRCCVSESILVVSWS